MTSSAGSRVTITRKVTATPMAATGPRPAVEFISAKSRQSMPTTTVAALARIGGRGPVQREGHRLVPVGMPAQLLAVAGDQQQGVVRAGADHQDGQDAWLCPLTVRSAYFARK